MFSKITVLTGTFRLFHYGHRNLIQHAYDLSLPVYVLANSDQGIKELGKSPGDNFIKRKEKILRTGMVERVLWFHTNPINWLRLLRPKYFVAGNDHTKEEILKKGGKFAEQIIIFQRTPGVSSTSLLKQN